MGKIKPEKTVFSLFPHLACLAKFFINKSELTCAKLSASLEE
jgi:hypothetical protein